MSNGRLKGTGSVKIGPRSLGEMPYKVDVGSGGQASLVEFERIYGDRQPHLVALLVPDLEEMKRFEGDPDGMQKALSKAVDRVNAELSVIEKVRRFIVADEAFSVENEQLTPSMKIRRHVIGKAYGERLDALYKR